jgi:hypothetical protein
MEESIFFSWSHLVSEGTKHTSSIWLIWTDLLMIDRTTPLLLLFLFVKLCLLGTTVVPVHRFITRLLNTTTDHQTRPTTDEKLQPCNNRPTAKPLKVRLCSTVVEHGRCALSIDEPRAYGRSLAGCSRDRTESALISSLESAHHQ